ncbi:restriction endonuclease subunit S [Arthrobacter sp. UYEF3]|uniref:restriction endonuclease subunit S n=1 Tax=Arthrobacter sp. UYEF3 TaxID=1756365 RepID=UPI003390E80D
MTTSLTTVTKLGRSGAFLKGQGIRRTDVQSTGTLCLRYGEIYTKFDDYTDRLVSHVSAEIASSAVRLRYGDIVFAGSGETKADIGKCTAWVGNAEAVVGGDTIILRGHGQDPVYLATLLNTPTVARQKASRGQGDAVVHISARSLADLDVSLPSIETQTKVAAAIRDADCLVTSLERLIAKKQSVKQGLMQQLLTGETRLLGFTGDWESHSLDKLATVDPEALSSDTDPNEPLDYISLEDVSRGALLGSSRITFQHAPSRARRIVRKMDVLFGTVRPNLQSHMLYRGGLPRPIASTGFAVIRANTSKSDPDFLFNILMSHLATAQIERIIAGSNYPAVSSGDVRALTFKVPGVTEQTAIGAFLSDVDSEIEVLRTRLLKLRSVKEGMLQEMLADRDLPQFAEAKA